MRILVVCEGKHEWSGALKNLLVKLGGDEGGLEFDRVSNNEIHAVHGKGKGYFKRALRWLIEAEKRGVDGLILVIDEDGKRERIGEIQEAVPIAASACDGCCDKGFRRLDAGR